MELAIWPLGNDGAAAKVETGAARIAVRPAAVARAERDDLFSGGETWVGEDGCLSGRRGGLFRRRRGGRGAGGSGLALPFVRAGVATTASTWSTVTTP